VPVGNHPPTEIGEPDPGLTRVKICGITRIQDALLAADLGASAVGLVFWPGSPRFIDPYRARAIAAALPPGVMPIGVFVDQPAEFVMGVAHLIPLGAVQLHGSESIESLARLAYRLIKAVPVAEGFDVDAIDLVPLYVTVLLDAHDPVRRGGTGRTIDWSVAAAIARRRRTILSGGLTAANVGEAVTRVRPYMIDVSSGVESRPGLKDPVKLRELFAALAAVRGQNQNRR
jgi:phosphoribosylanthranilate isomerase